MQSTPPDLLADPRRHIRLPGTSNLRDLGGYAAADGRRVKWGKLFRSGAMPMLGEADWAWMREQGITTVCDLRSDPEREVAPTRWAGPTETRHMLANYDAGLIFGRSFIPAREAGAVNDLHENLYALLADILAPAFAEMFAALLDEQAPLIVHCSAGQDRTGIAVGLLLSLLGVDRETVFADYLLSTSCRQFDKELDRPGLAAFADTNLVARFYTDAIRRNGMNAVKPKKLVNARGEALLKPALDTIEAKFGSLEAYAADVLGVDETGAVRLRALYLEPATGPA